MTDYFKLPNLQIAQRNIFVDYQKNFKGMSLKIHHYVINVDMS